MHKARALCNSIFCESHYYKVTAGFHKPGTLISTQYLKSNHHLFVFQDRLSYVTITHEPQNCSHLTQQS